MLSVVTRMSFLFLVHQFFQVRQTRIPEILAIKQTLSFVSEICIIKLSITFHLMGYIIFLYCRYNLSLSFEESIFGGHKDIEVTRFETCVNCSGTGAKSSACIKSCGDCGGRGGVMKTQRTPFGTVSKVS